MESLQVVGETAVVGGHRKPSYHDQTRVETHLIRICISKQKWQQMQSPLNDARYVSEADRSVQLGQREWEGGTGERWAQRGQEGPDHPEPIEAP